MGDGFEVGAAPGFAGPVDGAGRAAAATQAAAERAREEAKQKALVGEVLPPDGQPAEDPAAAAARAEAELRAGVLGFWAVVGKVLEKRVGKEWALEAGELELLATGTMPLARQVMESVGTPPPLLLAAGTVALVFGPKLAALETNKPPEGSAPGSA